jgi:hypothetical protein
VPGYGWALRGDVVGEGSGRGSRCVRGRLTEFLRTCVEVWEAYGGGGAGAFELSRRMIEAMRGENEYKL